MCLCECGCVGCMGECVCESLVCLLLVRKTLISKKNECDVLLEQLMEDAGHKSSI